MAAKEPAPEKLGLVKVSAEQVEPADLATLTVFYRDGRSVIKVTGGSVVPGKLVVETTTGSIDAVYTLESIDTVDESPEKIVAAFSTWPSLSDALHDDNT